MNGNKKTRGAFYYTFLAFKHGKVACQTLVMILTNGCTIMHEFHKSVLLPKHQSLLHSWINAYFGLYQKYMCMNETTFFLTKLQPSFWHMKISIMLKWKDKWWKHLCDLFPFIDDFKLHVQSKQKSKPDWMLPPKLQLLIPIYSCLPNGLPFTSCLIKLSSVKKTAF